ncbi:hypothetical protein KKB18_12680 [bacterium]|nr:hypothetical protein [bacterium]
MIKIFNNAKVSENVEIGEFSVIGKASRPSFNVSLNRVEFSKKLNPQDTVVSHGCYIGAQVLIEEGVRIGPNCIIESKCVIEKGTTIGTNTLIVHGSRILQGVQIADDCVVGGFIADRTVIGERCRVLGALLHKQDDPYLPWDDNIEPSPTLGKNVFVGVGAIVLGDVHISDNVYICSGAIVTKDIPSFNIVKRINEVIPKSKWHGKLKESIFWKELNEG